MKILALSLGLLATMVSADFQQCSRENCPDEWQTCDASKKCVRAIKYCEDRCQLDQSCWNKCLKARKIKSAYLVAKCAQPNGCFDDQEQQDEEEEEVVQDQTNNVQIPDTAVALQQCAGQRCPQLWQACTKDSGCLVALLDCLKNCNTSEQCWVKCLPPKNNGNAVSVALCAQSKKCIQTTGPSTQIGNIQKCAQQKCSNQWNGCLKDPKCLVSLFECFNKCQTNVICWIGCLPGKGSSTSINVALCAQSNQCL